MFSLVTVGSNNIDRSKIFYDALFTSLGAEHSIIDPK